MKVLRAFLLSFVLAACHRTATEPDCTSTSAATSSTSAPVVGNWAAELGSGILLTIDWDVYRGEAADDSLASIVARRLIKALGDSVGPALLFLIADHREAAVPAAGMYIYMKLPKGKLEQLLFSAELSYRVRSIAYRALAELEAPEKALLRGDGRVYLGGARQNFVCEVAQGFLTSTSDSVTPWILRGMLERMEREAQRSSGAQAFLSWPTIRRAQSKLRERGMSELPTAPSLRQGAQIVKPARRF